MTDHPRALVTTLLEAVSHGNEDAVDDLVPVLYDELKGLAADYLRRERGAHTLQATALVHEAYLRLVDQRNIDEHSRSHFVAIAANVMRRVLVDHARGRNRKKRGGAWHRVSIDGGQLSADSRQLDITDLTSLLDKLGEVDARQARIVELRFFGDLTIEDTAEVMGLSVGTVNKEWRMARAWLLQRL